MLWKDFFPGSNLPSTDVLEAVLDIFEYQRQYVTHLAAI